MRKKEVQLTFNHSDEPPSPERLGERIRVFREEQGLTQENLAVSLGIKAVTILRWENNSSKPSPSLAKKLEGLGFPSIGIAETKHTSRPMSTLDKDVKKGLGIEIKTHIRLNKTDYPFMPAPYVINGPFDQLAFFDELFRMQECAIPPCDDATYLRRLSAVSVLPESGASTYQNLLENPRPTATHWNPNYGPHGWHRYLGRFPAHLVRAIINHFGAKPGETIYDPFVGSGTTLVECRLLGMRGIGTDVCPLSCLMARAKSQFPQDTDSLERLAESLVQFYKREWNAFVGHRNFSEITHSQVIDRDGNPIRPFSNYEKWLTTEALLGTSIIVQYAASLSGYQRDFLACALSGAMRSIGNVDVDVARAEYRATPRENVDVLKLVSRSLKNMIHDIEASVSTHARLIGQPQDIQVLNCSLLDNTMAPGSIDHILTSPPYGVESASYLRTHLLSYRCLYPLLEHDPYENSAQIIGSEYVPDNALTTENWVSAEYSPSFSEFFSNELRDETSQKILQRKHMMMHFFDDMTRVASSFHRWLRPKGRIAFIIGNKRVGLKVIPTDKIIAEIFGKFYLRLDNVVTHKLKCNNSNSEVPWQERVIQDEFLMMFTKE